MAIRPHDSRELPQLTMTSHTGDTLAHAAREKNRKKFDEFLICDIDAHVTDVVDEAAGEATV